MTVSDFESAKREYERRIAYQSGKYEGVGLENNTRLVKRGDDRYAVKLHGTDVVTYHADGRVTLATGGWKTRTTKNRINKYAPVRIVQRDYEWYVDGHKWRDVRRGEGYYRDEVDLDADGNVIPATADA